MSKTNPLIIVPLDGSPLSEGALPYATALAQATSSSVLLVTVWEGAEGTLVTTFPDLADDLFRRGHEHYEGYLRDIADQLQQKKITTEAQVLTGDAADEVLKLIEERAPRMLTLATHGRSGISRWVYGSVASKLLREAPVPTLAVGPKALERGVSAATIGRILLPLDGSELAEIALAPARELADALGAELVLARVLRWMSQAYVFGVPDVDVVRIDEELGKAAEEQLARVKASLGAKAKVETKVLRGMPADALLDLVESERIDLVVMASHTRGGLARAVLGSVADRMLQGSAPVLLIRPGGE